MGASPSKHGSILSGGTLVPEIQLGTNHGVIPEDTVPYSGSKQEHYIVLIESKITNKMNWFTEGKPVTESNVQTYYDTLRQQCANSFRFSTFIRVPLAQKGGGLGKAIIQFQGKILDIISILTKNVYYSLFLSLFPLAMS